MTVKILSTEVVCQGGPPRLKDSLAKSWHLSWASRKYRSLIAWYFKGYKYIWVHKKSQVLNCLQIPQNMYRIYWEVCFHGNSNQFIQDCSFLGHDVPFCRYMNLYIYKIVKFMMSWPLVVSKMCISNIKMT